MLVYRITQTKYAHSLEVPGFSARWNTNGHKIIYTAGSLALACLENLVHKTGAALVSGTYSVSVIETPDPSTLLEVTLEHLQMISLAWYSVPNYIITQRQGNTWVQDLSSLILKVPSAIIDKEYNYLLNPGHPEFKKVSIKSVTPFNFDPRLKVS